MANTSFKFRTPQSSLGVTRLSARHSPGLSIEFVSTLISDHLPSVDRQDGESRPEGESAENTDALPVAVLGGACNLPTREVGYTQHGTAFARDGDGVMFPRLLRHLALRV